MTPMIVTPKRYVDSRGWFCETWNRSAFEAMGIREDFCQDNHSLSGQSSTLRGLHFQNEPYAQSKLVRVVKGRIYDVVVDIRRASPTFKRWVGVELSAEMGNQLFVPPGYAHGFITLEPNTEVSYKVDAYYAPACDCGIAWDDPEIGVDWPIIGGIPILSSKDAALPRLAEAAFNFPYDGNPLVPLTS